MIERPLFLTTDVGALAAMMTLPDGPPIGATVIVQGIGSTRSGVNQTFTRLARTLAAVGVATLRTDYSGLAESWDADATRQSAGVRALIGAYREVTDAPLLMVASCYGLGPTAAMCRELPVAGAIIIAPPLRRRNDESKPRARSNLRPRAIGVRLRDGKQRQIRFGQVDHVPAATALQDIVTHTPTLVLVGAQDRSTDLLVELVPQLAPIGQIELQVIDGQTLHGAKSRESQSAIHDGVLSWVERLVGAETRT